MTDDHIGSFHTRRKEARRKKGRGKKGEKKKGREKRREKTEKKRKARAAILGKDGNTDDGGTRAESGEEAAPGNREGRTSGAKPGHRDAPRLGRGEPIESAKRGCRSASEMGGGAGISTGR